MLESFHELSTLWLSDALPLHSTGTDQCFGGTWALLLLLGRCNTQHTRKHSVHFCIPKATTYPCSSSAQVWGSFRRACWAWVLLRLSAASLQALIYLQVHGTCLLEHPGSCLCRVLPPLCKHLAHIPPLNRGWGLSASNHPLHWSKCLPTSPWCWLLGLETFALLLQAWAQCIGIIYTQDTCNWGLKLRGSLKENRLLFSAVQRNPWSLMTETGRKRRCTYESSLLKTCYF